MIKRLRYLNNVFSNSKIPAVRCNSQNIEIRFKIHLTATICKNWIISFLLHTMMQCIYEKLIKNGRFRKQWKDIKFGFWKMFYSIHFHENNPAPNNYNVSLYIKYLFIEFGQDVTKNYPLEIIFINVS